MVLILPALLLALAVSAYVNAAELALFSLSDSRVRALADEGFRGSAALVALRNDPRRLLALLRLGKAISAAAAAALAGALGWAAAGAGGLVGAIVAAAVVILVLGELLPLRIAADRNVGLALSMAPFLLTMTRLGGPLLGLLDRVPHALLVRGGGAGRVLESEIRQISTLGESQGVIEDHERQLIERALRLDESKAWDIMTPRVDIVAWRADLTLAQVAPEFGSVPYSRVPVYVDTIDHVTGVLYLRDAYQALLAGQRDVPLASLAREPLIVPGSISLSRLLREFQTRRIHLALVVDEYGGTDGLVTLEDVLEELVGEIEDEMDVSEESIIRISRHEIVAAGDADLREINHILNASLPQLEHRSLNGFLLEELGRVPQAGEEIEREGIVIQVLEATETQVLRARLRRAAAGPDADHGGADADPGASPASSPEDRDGVTPDSSRGAVHGAVTSAGAMREAGHAAERRDRRD